MPITSEQKADRAFFILVAGLLVLVAVLLPVARGIDDRHDRMRPMYDDLRAVEWLEYKSISAGNGPVPVDLEDGASAEIAGEEFAPSTGVHVVVEADGDDSYCARVSNQFGDVSDLHCLDLAHPPRDPDGPVRDPASG